MSFYLTLPSNSSLGVHPRNNQTQFTTNLPQEINLEGQWEAGLAEIQFSNTYAILEEGLMYLMVKKKARRNPKIPKYKTSSAKAIVEGGFFASNHHFVEHVNEKIKTLCGEHVYLDYNITTNKVTVVITSAIFTIRMNHRLMDVLGLGHIHSEKNPADIDTFKIGLHPAERPVDIYQNFKGIFIYCDLVRPRPCGDVMTPLLRTIPVGDEQSGTYHKIFVKPHYIPLARQAFRSVEILLNTDTGKPLSFSSGHTIATLHFRRVKPE